MSETKENKTVTFDVDENGNIHGLEGCKKAFFAFVEDEKVYCKVSWPKGRYTVSVNEDDQRITFHTDSNLRIVCGHPVEPKPECIKVWAGRVWVCA